VTWNRPKGKTDTLSEGTRIGTVAQHSRRAHDWSESKARDSIDTSRKQDRFEHGTGGSLAVGSPNGDDHRFEPEIQTLCDPPDPVKPEFDRAGVK